MAEEIINIASADENRMKMLKGFDETEAGVKGLIDSGLIKVPKIFVRPSEELAEDELTYKNTTQIQVPVIDLSDIQINAGRRKRIVEQVRIASETWGFFQVVNHGIPLTVLDGMIDGVRKFNEQDVEEKRSIIRGITREKGVASFLQEAAVEYSKNVEILGNILLGLLSEALELKTDHLKNMECSEGHRLHCHYYPTCPEPQLAVGTAKHSDVGFLTILLQNKLVTGLQVLHQGQWVDILPIPGGLVINIGDLLQNKTYGPIEELVSEENPPIYRDVLLGEYAAKFLNTALDKYLALDYYKV
ncbi:hypothetical protein DH2020_004709 [Rehmannia glutinosa]|uniref:Uncharacterized protein n=1 Tax=Rehmannia glutinosa TaxID=99300 RepID=A0ABR0XQ46_REHGL